MKISFRLSAFWLVTLVSVAFLQACAHQAPKQDLGANDQFGWVYSPANDRAARVLLVPQWHLPPQTNTVYSSAGLPQKENQQAIYRQLVEWIENGQVRSVVVEGCEGEIKDGFDTRFNGWSLADLQKLSAEQLDGAMTQVGIKLKAKVGPKAQVLCGDSLELIKKHQLALSDMRGLLGFKIRIAQFKDQPEKRADYVATLREVLKLPPQTTEADALNVLDERLRTRLQDFKAILHQRNEVFMRTAKFARPIAAVVIGAIHIDDLSAQFKAQNISTQTFEPRGLKGDESELLAQIETLLGAKSAAPGEGAK